MSWVGEACVSGLWLIGRLFFAGEDCVPGELVGVMLGRGFLIGDGFCAVLGQLVV